MFNCILLLTNSMNETEIEIINIHDSENSQCLLDWCSY